MSDLSSMGKLAEDAIRARAHEISQEDGAESAERNWLRAERELTVVHDYDTPDRDLEAAGVQVSRLPLEVGGI